MGGERYSKEETAGGCGGGLSTTFGTEREEVDEVKVHSFETRKGRKRLHNSERGNQTTEKNAPFLPPHPDREKNATTKLVETRYPFFINTVSSRGRNVWKKGTPSMRKGKEAMYEKKGTA